MTTSPSKCRRSQRHSNLESYYQEYQNILKHLLLMTQQQQQKQQQQSPEKERSQCHVPNLTTTTPTSSSPASIVVQQKLQRECLNLLQLMTSEAVRDGCKDDDDDDDVKEEWLARIALYKSQLEQVISGDRQLEKHTSKTTTPVPQQTKQQSPPTPSAWTKALSWASRKSSDTNTSTTNTTLQQQQQQQQPAKPTQTHLQPPTTKRTPQASDVSYSPSLSVPTSTSSPSWAATTKSTTAHVPAPSVPSWAATTATENPCHPPSPYDSHQQYDQRRQGIFAASAAETTDHAPPAWAVTSSSASGAVVSSEAPPSWTRNRPTNISKEDILGGCGGVKSYIRPDTNSAPASRMQHPSESMAAQQLERLEHARRVMRETEEIAENIGHQLRSDRETMQRSHQGVQQMGYMTYQAHGLLRNMTKPWYKPW